MSDYQHAFSVPRRTQLGQEHLDIPGNLIEVASAVRKMFGNFVMALGICPGCALAGLAMGVQSHDVVHDMAEEDTDQEAGEDKPVVH